MPHSTRIGRLFSTLSATLVLQLLSCSGSDAVAPRAAVSGITVYLRGSGADVTDTSLVSLDGAAGMKVSSSHSVIFRSIASGTHALSVSGFAQNCRVDGPNPIVVNAPAGDMAAVEIRLVCTATTGVIAVMVASSGAWDPLSFSVQIDDGPAQQVWPNDKTFIDNVGPGAHVVKVLDLPPPCKVVGDASTPVSISVGTTKPDTAEASFEIMCVLVGPVEDGGWQIAFQRGDTSIVLVREDGSGTHTLTGGLAPSWSPDGKFLAYQRERCISDQDCNENLWMIRVDGSESRAITNTAGFLDSDPAISPDGRSISFIRFWLGVDQSYLIVSDVTGRAPRILSIWDPYSTPTWSPDGTQIAFTCEGPSPNWELDICLVKSASDCTSYFYGCALPELVHLTNSRFVESEPAWSPDGAHIAITLACGGAICPPGVVSNESYIALLDPLTRAVTPIIPGHSAAWSPDGRHLVFASNNTSSPGLKVIGLDGTGLRSLTSDLSDTAPSWR